MSRRGPIVNPHANSHRRAGPAREGSGRHDQSLHFAGLFYRRWSMITVPYGAAGGSLKARSGIGMTGSDKWMLSERLRTSADKVRLKKDISHLFRSRQRPPSVKLRLGGIQGRSGRGHVHANDRCRGHDPIHEAGRCRVCSRRADGGRTAAQVHHDRRRLRRSSGSKPHPSATGRCTRLSRRLRFCWPMVTSSCAHRRTPIAI